MLRAIEFYLKIFIWHLKVTMRRCLRKIFYNVDFYQDTFKPKSGTYKVRTDLIDKIYISSSHKKQIKEKGMHSKLTKFRALAQIFDTSLDIRLHPFRKLDQGMVVGGEWETQTNIMKLEDSQLHKAAFSRFVLGQSWTETDYYKNYISFPLISRKRSQLDVIMWEKLFYKIKKEGYISQQELSKVVCPNCKFRNAELGLCTRCNHKIDNTNAIRSYINYLQLGEIAIHIGKNGDLYLSQGRHRLTFANLLNIDYVYVNIIVRHGLWVAFRESLIKQLKENIFSLSYPFTHVDLKNIPSKYGHGVFRIISQNLDLKAGKILVFRAHLGYFCQKFEEIGFDCYAFESDKKVIDILTKLKRAERKNFKIIENIMEDYTNVPKDIDIVIATGKISDLRRDFRSKKAFFNRMNVKVAFLHLHSNNSNSNEKLLEEIANNYILNNWEQIGSADDRTPIYRLYSS